MKRAAFFLFLAAIIAPGGCASFEPQPSPVLGANSSKLIVRNDRIFIPVRINGYTVDALLDSGAELSVLDKAFAAEIGIATFGADTAKGTGGTTDASFSQDVVIEAAGLTLAGGVVAIIDLSDISRRLIGSPVNAIVGRELFDAARLAIDVDGERIAVVDRSADPHGVKLTTTTHNGLETIPVSIDGNMPAQAEFDLGNGGDVLIGARYAAELGLDTPDRLLGKETGGGLGGELVRDLVLLETIDVAGVIFEDVTAAIDRTENAADINIGVKLLREFKITADFSQSTIWLNPK